MKLFRLSLPNFLKKLKSHVTLHLWAIYFLKNSTLQKIDFPILGSYFRFQLCNARGIFHHFFFGAMLQKKWNEINQNSRVRIILFNDLNLSRKLWKIKIFRKKKRKQVLKDVREQTFIQTNYLFSFLKNIIPVFFLLEEMLRVSVFCFFFFHLFTGFKIPKKTN